MENEEFTDVEDSGLVKDLRKQLKEALKQNKIYEEELSEFRSAARQKTVGELLEANGVNPKAAKFVPSDLDDDEVVDWLKDNQDLFAGMKVSEPEKASGESPVSAEDRAEMARANDLVSEAAAPEKISDLEMRMDNAESPEEINEILAEYQSYRV